MWELVFDRSDCHVYDLADHVVDGLPSVLAYCDLRNGDRRRWRGTLHHLDPCYVLAAFQNCTHVGVNP